MIFNLNYCFCSHVYRVNLNLFYQNCVLPVWWHHGRLPNRSVRLCLHYFILVQPADSNWCIYCVLQLGTYKFFLFKMCVWRLESVAHSESVDIFWSLFTIYWLYILGSQWYRLVSWTDAVVSYGHYEHYWSTRWTQMGSVYIS